MSEFPRMHVSLYVSNIENTVNFYKTFFGLEPNKVKASYAKFILEKPSLIISFVENEQRVKSNFGHMGFQVESEDDLKNRLEFMQLKNVSVLEEIGTNCCYATQDKFWVSDPDGHKWEVYYFHADSEFNDPEYSEESNEVCCMPVEDAKPKVQISDLNILNCEPGSGCC